MIRKSTTNVWSMAPKAAVLLTAALVGACGSDSNAAVDAATDGASGTGRDGAAGGGGGTDGGSAADPDGGSGPTGSTPGTVLDGGVSTSGRYDVNTTLPAVPKLENVVGVVTSDTVTVTFLPVDDAKDYRVYVLPKDEDVVTDGSAVYVKNATYRCAGAREAPNVDHDGSAPGESIGARTLVDNQDVDGYRRTLADAALGYVYYAPGDGRTPVYVLGDPYAHSDNWAFIARYKASRTKLYTTSSSERDQLLAKGWRDDGVAFYVPSAASATTADIYTSLGGDGHTRYYFRDGAEKSARQGAKVAFPVLKDKAPGTDTLYRVFYTKYQASSHDELVYGKTMFERVRFQGSDKPVTQVTWSGLSGPTTLVVEALDVQCPYAGRLAAQPIAEDTQGATTDTGSVTYATALTPEQARAASARGELYLNGQSADKTVPKAVARAFLDVAPQPNEAFDFFEDFAPGKDLPPLRDTGCGTPSGNCYQQWREVSSAYDVHWHTIATGQRAIGKEFGELWVRYADYAADTNGKFRITPLQKASVNADTYLHATMEVTAVSTARRYPQIIVSDRSAPVQDFLDQGNTVIMQTFRWWPNYLELQVCDHRGWDVNNQCPFFQFYDRLDGSGQSVSVAPVDEVSELTGPDIRTRFDIFLSTKRAYLMLDRKPFGCVDLPASGIPRGDVTVTFGDVLYHSAADFPMGYHKRFVAYETERRFDNLGFSSNVAAPAWDHDRIPCVPASSVDIHR